jgi:hypothetical protein
MWRWLAGGSSGARGAGAAGVAALRCAAATGCRLRRGLLLGSPRSPAPLQPRQAIPAGCCGADCSRRCAACAGAAAAAAAAARLAAARCPGRRRRSNHGCKRPKRRSPAPCAPPAARAAARPGGSAPACARTRGRACASQRQQRRCGAALSAAAGRRASRRRSAAAAATGAAAAAAAAAARSCCAPRARRRRRRCCRPRASRATSCCAATASPSPRARRAPRRSRAGRSARVSACASTRWPQRSPTLQTAPSRRSRSAPASRSWPTSLARAITCRCGPAEARGAALAAGRAAPGAPLSHPVTPVRHLALHARRAPPPRTNPAAPRRRLPPIAPAGALARPRARRPREGPARRALPDYSGCLRLGARQGPPPGALQVRRQAPQEGVRPAGCSARKHRTASVMQRQAEPSHKLGSLRGQ